MQIAELFAFLKLEGASQAAAQLVSFRKDTLAAKAALLGLVVGLERVTAAARQMALSLDKYEIFTGQSAQDLQQLSFTAAQAGVSMDELAGTIQGLQKQKNEMLMGQGVNPAWVLLGIDPNSDPVEMLEQIRNSVKNFPPDLAKTLANQAGLSDNIFYMLQKSSEGFDRLNKKYLITKQNKNDLLDLNRQWQMFIFYLKQLGGKLTALNAGPLGELFAGLIRVAQGIYDAIVWFKNFADANKEVYAILLLIAAALAPVSTLIAAIYLVVEDLIVALQGGESVFGSFSKWLDEVSGNKFGDGILKLVENIKTLYSWLSKIEHMQFNALKWILEKAGDILGKITGGIGSLSGPGQEMRTKDQLAAASFQNDPEGYAARFMAKDAGISTTSNQTNNTNNISVTINGIENAEEVRRAGNEIAEEISNSQFLSPIPAN